MEHIKNAPADVKRAVETASIEVPVPRFQSRGDRQSVAYIEVNYLTWGMVRIKVQVYYSINQGSGGSRWHVMACGRRGSFPTRKEAVKHARELGRQVAFDEVARVQAKLREEREATEIAERFAAAKTENNERIQLAARLSMARGVVTSYEERLKALDAEIFADVSGAEKC